LDTQSKVSSRMMTSQMPKFLIAVSQIDENEKSIYIVNQVKVINQNGRISKVLHR